MDAFILYAAPFAPWVAIASLLGMVIIMVNVHGRRLERHRAWLFVLQVRIENLHKERKTAFARSIQVPSPFRTVVPESEPRPPPLSRARTIEVDEAMILTRDTVPYPKKPTEGEET